MTEAILTEIQTEGKHGSLRRWLEYFNEGMGLYAITRMTLYNWRKGHRPDPRILQHALEVYPAEDPRGEWARELLQAEGEAE